MAGKKIRILDNKGYEDKIKISEIYIARMKCFALYIIVDGQALAINSESTIKYEYLEEK